MKEYLQKIEKILKYIVEMFKSILAIFIFSSLKSRTKNMAVSNTCIVLGNGPSASSFFETLDYNNHEPLFVVNFFCLSDLFYKTRPKYYTMIDPNFFDISKIDSDNMKGLFDAFSKVDWDMVVFIPNHRKKSKVITQLQLVNNRIKYIPINTTPVDGPSWFRHYFYKKQLGVPICYNVVNAALCFTIGMGYKNIELYGVEHSWLKNITHDKDGFLCTVDTHVYGKEYVRIPRGFLEIGLMNFSECLKTYRYIKEFSDTIGVHILNKTPNSFIDIFDKQ